MRESRTYGSVRGGYRKVSVYSIVGVAIYETDRANNRILQADPGL